jgi:hypothetical protein
VSAASRATEAAVAARASAVAAEVASRSLSGALFDNATVAAARAVRGKAQTTVLSSRRKPPTADARRVLNAGVDAADVMLRAGGGDEAAAIFRKLAGQVEDVSIGRTTQTINQARLEGSVRGAWYESKNALMMETRSFDVDVWNKRVAEYNARLTSKVPNSASADIAANDVAGTFIHELTHVLDYVSERKLGTPNMLRNKIVDDEIFDRVKVVFKGFDESGDLAQARQWDYAASTPSEALPELSRMYFQGADSLGDAAAGKAWREAYPDLAGWVEDNVLDPSLVGF